ncbi:hypothetical protein HHI36_001865, partial [Cryptolaemus montrouzieri]
MESASTLNQGRHGCACQGLLQWELGLVVKFYPGPDGIVRVVQVKTNRSVKKLAPLPVDPT